MHLTQKQREILNIVIEGNTTHIHGRYGDVDIDEILERVPYSTTKQSLQFSLRSLISKSLVEKADLLCRRGRARRTYKPTQLAHKIYSASHA